MSTSALFEIQADAVKLARRITAAVEDAEPQDIDPATLNTLAGELVEIAGRVAYHRTRTPEYRAKLAGFLNRHREDDPR